jgi:hypothetical protein
MKAFCHAVWAECDSSKNVKMPKRHGKTPWWITFSQFQAGKLKRLYISMQKMGAAAHLPAVGMAMFQSSEGAR